MHPRVGMNLAAVGRASGSAYASPDRHLASHRFCSTVSWDRLWRQARAEPALFWDGCLGDNCSKTGTGLG